MPGGPATFVLSIKIAQHLAAELLYAYDELDMASTRIR